MPMRHTSVRVEGKNYRPFGDGRPLFQHTLDNLLACGRIQKVVIDTDSENIKEICEKHYRDVIIIDRPPHLRADTVPMNDILKHDINSVPSEFYIQTHSTNPLVKAETFKDIIDTFFEHYPLYDSLFSVTRRQTRYWDELARPLNHNQNILLRTQDLPAIYEENSCAYVFHGDTLLKRNNRIGDRPFMFELDPLEASDIDEEHDFIIAEMLYNVNK